MGCSKTQISEKFVAIKQVTFEDEISHQDSLEKSTELSESHRQQLSRIKNEITIHSKVCQGHKNIIQYHDSFQSKELTEMPSLSSQFIVMEYAESGELFDRIQPDIGLEDGVAHFYFRQLISAVNYLHKRSVCHRDLKPENLLLDRRGNLRIADFGLATIYRHRNQVHNRRLSTCCGSRPYVAPEVIWGNYDGPAADIWSCGVILYVLLLGSTAWDEPTEADEFFTRYCLNSEAQIRKSRPWNRLSGDSFNLLYRMLRLNEDDRLSGSQIQTHKWFSRNNVLLGADGQCVNDSLLASRFFQNTPVDNGQYSSSINDDNTLAPAFSQPQQLFEHCINDSLKTQSQEYNSFAFSQPIHQTILSQNVVIDQLSDMKFYDQSDVVKQLLNLNNGGFLTRFFVSCSLDRIRSSIEAILDDFLVPYKSFSHRISFSAVDKRKCPLNGEVCFYELNHATTLEMESLSQRIGSNALEFGLDGLISRNRLLVLFKRNRGDPLEFKRFFKAIKDTLLVENDIGLT